MDWRQTQVVLSQIASQGLKELRNKPERPLGRLNLPNTHTAQADSDTGLDLTEPSFAQTWFISSLSSQGGGSAFLHAAQWARDLLTTSEHNQQLAWRLQALISIKLHTSSFSAQGKQVYSCTDKATAPHRHPQRSLLEGRSLFAACLFCPACGQSASLWLWCGCSAQDTARLGFTPISLASPNKHSGFK